MTLPELTNTRKSTNGEFLASDLSREICPDPNAGCAYCSTAILDDRRECVLEHYLKSNQEQ